MYSLPSSEQTHKILKSAEGLESEEVWGQSSVHFKGEEQRSYWFICNIVWHLSLPEASAHILDSAGHFSFVETVIKHLF